MPSYRPIHFPIEHPPIMRFKSLPHFSSSLVTILPYLDCSSENIMNFLQISSLVANLPTTIIYESPIVFHPNKCNLVAISFEKPSSPRLN
jgi:hypothetical protein